MKQPRVSLGMPVYNGESYLRVALDSILAQTYSDFELIISDNGSTDRTQAICEEYVRHDPRIRYYRNEHNQGASWNFCRVAQLATGEYFRWAAVDDLLAPDCLRQCVEVLDSHPDVVLCTTQVEIIDSEGRSHGIYHEEPPLRTDAAEAHIRFLDLLRGHRCFEIFGLVRTSVLRRTPMLEAYGHADGILLSRISLMGRFYEIPSPLFAERMHPNQSINMFGAHTGKNAAADGPPDYRAYTAWFDPRKSGKIMFPYWRMLREYSAMIWHYPLPLGQRIRCAWHLAIWARKRRYWLGQDLKIAAGDIARRLRKSIRANPEKKRVA